MAASKQAKLAQEAQDEVAEEDESGSEKVSHPQSLYDQVNDEHVRRPNPATANKISNFWVTSGENAGR